MAHPTFETDFISCRAMLRLQITLDEPVEVVVQDFPITIFVSLNEGHSETSGADGVISRSGTTFLSPPQSPSLQPRLASSRTPSTVAYTGSFGSNLSLPPAILPPAATDQPPAEPREDMEFDLKEPHGPPTRTYTLPAYRPHETSPDQDLIRRDTDPLPLTGTDPLPLAATHPQRQDIPLLPPPPPRPTGSGELSTSPPSHSIFPRPREPKLFVSPTLHPQGLVGQPLRPSIDMSRRPSFNPSVSSSESGSGAGSFRGGGGGGNSAAGSLNSRQHPQQQQQQQQHPHLDYSKVKSWDIPTVAQWVWTIGLDGAEEIFINQAVDGESLLTFTEADLKEMGIDKVGPRRKLMLAIERLKNVVKKID
ncbi:hypothetical protein BDR26DRAFT_849981 [Obelidium mucronatum]|nr:hypothetical protein BDR26DRAFT_849981 [Obelidium mucronatum]